MLVTQSWLQSLDVGDRIRSFEFGARDLRMMLLIEEMLVTKMTNEVVSNIRHQHRYSQQISSKNSD